MKKQRGSLTKACLALPGLFALCLLMAGCRHRHAQAYPPPPPPEIEQPSPPPATGYSQSGHGRVLSSQVGIASWYGSPYHNARGANGKIYDQDAMTAAHRTLPLGTVVRVTNLATHQSAVVTITDRGPFVRGRILDLSRAAAIKTGIWRAGTGRVRLDVLRDPPSVDPNGRWCVQIGAFHHDGTARKLHEHLQRKYPRSSVIDFKGSTGYWVRIRPDGGSRRAALEIARLVQPSEGYAYVVRLD